MTVISGAQGTDERAIDTGFLNRLPEKLRKADAAHRYGLPVAILMVALAVRVAVVVITRHGYVPFTDDADYSRLAASIASGHGYGTTHLEYLHGPTAFRPPFYPAVLAIAYKIVGVSWSAGRVENAVIGTLAVAAVGFLAQQLWERKVMLTAMALAAVFPPLLIAGYGLGYEALLITLVTASLACTARARHSAQPWRWLVAAGVLAGFGALTRETAFVALVPLVCVAWRSASRPGRRVLQVSAALLAAVLVIAPWTIRNAIQLHAFVPVSTNTGFAAEGTYNSVSPHVRGGPAVWIQPGIDPASAKVLKTPSDQTEARATDALLHLSETYIENHPTYIFSVAWWNSVRLFDLRGPSDAIAVARFVPYNYNLVYLSVYTSYLVDVLVIVGCFTKRARQVEWYFWLTPVLFFVGVILISGNIRYAALLQPFMVLLASLTLVAGYERWQSRRSEVPSEIEEREEFTTKA